MLLLKDGATLFFGEIGPGASNLVGYFEEKGARKCRSEENPAEWMLEVTEASSGTQSWAEKWQLSTEKQDATRQLQSHAARSDLHLTNEDKTSKGPQSEFAVPLQQQIFVLMKRVFRDQWRNPVHLHTKTAVCIGLVCFVAINFPSCSQIGR